MNDLLNDPIFHWTDVGNGRHAGGLPELLAFMADTSQPGIIGFDQLQAHQHHPWHAFLVQLAAMVLHRAGTSPPGPTDAKWWKAQLLELAGGCAEAWLLVVEDLSKPAFLQPPLPDGRAALKNEAISPDAVDIFQAAKDHDCKHTRAGRASEEQWVFSLVCYQTFQGYIANRNYGVVRMNSGSSNRPGIAASQGFRLDERFRRDVMCLTNKRSLALVVGWSDKGVPLIWIMPWDGTTSMAITECDPFCIEICLRIRLERSETAGSLRAMYGSKSKRRLTGTEQLKGNVGDPWTPIERSESKALTLGEAGFTYKKVSDLLLSGEYETSVCGVLQDNDCWWMGQALVRGDGRTDGYHERLVPLSPRAVGLLRRTDARQRLSQRATAMTEDAGEMRAILNRALCALAQPSKTGEGSKLEFRDNHGRSWLDRLDSVVDARFFESLWYCAEQDDEAARVAWQGFLRDTARCLLEDAETKLSAESTWRYRAIHHAEGLFYGGMKKKFTALYAKEHAQ